MNVKRDKQTKEDQRNAARVRRGVVVRPGLYRLDDGFYCQVKKSSEASKLRPSSSSLVRASA